MQAETATSPYTSLQPIPILSTAPACLLLPLLLLLFAVSAAWQTNKQQEEVVVVVVAIVVAAASLVVAPVVALPVVAATAVVAAPCCCCCCHSSQDDNELKARMKTSRFSTAPTRDKSAMIPFGSAQSDSHKPKLAHFDSKISIKYC